MRRASAHSKAAWVVRLQESPKPCGVSTQRQKVDAVNIWGFDRRLPGGVRDGHSREKPRTLASDPGDGRVRRTGVQPRLQFK